MMRIALPLLALSLVAAPAAAQSLPKVGYVDLQRALNESAKGMRAKEQFKKEVDKLQDSLKKQKDAVERLKQQLEKKSMVMKDEERVELEDDYRRKLRDFERAYKDSQGDLQKKDNDLTAAILGELQAVLAEYGKKEGYTLILETTSSAVLYGDESADLTDELIELYNASSK